jgi:hypothetical protein
MQNHIVFDFSTPVRYSYKLQDDVMFHIEKTTESVARLYFTNEHDSPIEKPRIFHVYTYLYDDVDTTCVLLRPVQDMHYFICWTDSYSIEYEQKEIVKIDSQRTWRINYTDPEKDN